MTNVYNPNWLRQKGSRENCCTVSTLQLDTEGTKGTTAYWCEFSAWMGDVYMID